MEANQEELVEVIQGLHDELRYRVQKGSTSTYLIISIIRFYSSSLLVTRLTRLLQI